MNLKESLERIEELENNEEILEGRVDDLHYELENNNDEIERLENKEFSKSDFNDTFYIELCDCSSTGLKQYIGDFKHKRVYIIIE